MSLTTAVTDPGLVFTVTVCSTLVLFFSGWEKERGFISMSRLLDIVLLRKGWLKSAKEVNKLLGVAAISLLGFSALLGSYAFGQLMSIAGLGLLAPIIALMRVGIAFHATLLATVHFVFSFWNWCTFNPIALLRDKRWFTMTLGVIALAVLASSVIVRGSQGVSAEFAILISYFLGTAHLLLFSINSTTGAIEVRPIVWLPLMLAPVLLGDVFWVYIWKGA
jgi:hypothetical protein